MDWPEVWGGAVTYIDGVVCWFGWFGRKNDTFSLSHYFPEDIVLVCPSSREKRINEKKKKKPHAIKAWGPNWY